MRPQSMVPYGDTQRGQLPIEIAQYVRPPVHRSVEGSGRGEQVNGTEQDRIRPPYWRICLGGGSHQ